MNFANVKSLTVPEGNVVKILEGSTVLWSKASPAPGIVLPPSNQIWYEATEQLTESNIGNPTSHTFDSTTGRGVLTYAKDVTSSTAITVDAFREQPSLTKIWWPASCEGWYNDCMHSCPGLQEIYAGSGLQSISSGVCNNGTTPRKIVLVDNDYFYKNETGLVKKSNNTLLLGTYNLDIRDTPCTTLGSRCMADMALNGATLYFPNTVTAFTGDYNISKSNASFTVYFYSTVAPTLSHNFNLYSTNTITVHIPVGSLSSYQDNWSTLLAFDKLNFIEDL